MMIAAARSPIAYRVDPSLPPFFHSIRGRGGVVQSIGIWPKTQTKTGTHSQTKSTRFLPPSQNTPTPSKEKRPPPPTPKNLTPQTLAGIRSGLPVQGIGERVASDHTGVHLQGALPVSGSYSNAHAITPLAETSPNLYIDWIFDVIIGYRSWQSLKTTRKT